MTTETKPPANMTYCPQCGGYGDIGCSEGEVYPDACYKCGTTGYVTVEVAEQYFADQKEARELYAAEAKRRRLAREAAMARGDDDYENWAPEPYWL